ncbi:MAG: amidohydrolase family protein [Polyangiaceae bacterium]|nr:amidohydrolase family protein [Polyangiaceae bacterium]
MRCFAVAAAMTFAVGNTQAQVGQPANNKPIAVQSTNTPVTQKTIAVVGAKIYSGEGDPIENGTVIVIDDKIKAVGKDIAVPAGAEVIQAKGAVVTPGFVDAITHVGLAEIDLEKSANDESDSKGDDRIRAAYRAVDAFNPESTVIAVTRLGGITSVGVVPSGGVIAGLSAWADLTGKGASDALTNTSLAVHVYLSAGSDPQGGSRGAIVRAVREAFDDARFFQKNKSAWERNQSRPFSAGRLDLETLSLTFGASGAGAKKTQPKVPVVFHADKASTILSALSVAQEFNLTPIIAGGAEAWKVRTTLAKAKVPVIVNPIQPGPDSFDTLGTRDNNAALLHEAGVPVIISTGETHNSRKLRQLAGNAVRAGLPHSAAITSITKTPAEAFGMGEKYGTLKDGKWANLVIWSGDPLELSTKVTTLFIRGKKVPLVSRQTELLKKYRVARQ